MKILFSLALFIIWAFLANAAEITGFTVFQREQVTPKIKAPGVLNPGDAPNYPSTFGGIVCRDKNFSIYSDNPDERREVWFDSAGTAEYMEVVTICGTTQ